MRAVYFALVLLVAGAVAWFYLSGDTGSAEGRPPAAPAPVTAWTLAEEPFQSRVEALGSLRAWESVTITSSVSETVAGLHFEDGDRSLRRRLGVGAIALIRVATIDQCLAPLGPMRSSPADRHAWSRLPSRVFIFLRPLALQQN